MDEMEENNMDVYAKMKEMKIELPAPPPKGASTRRFRSLGTSCFTVPGAALIWGMGIRFSESWGEI